MFNLILSSMNSERLEPSERSFIVLANSNPLWANTFATTINKAGAWFSSQCMSDLAWEQIKSAKNAVTIPASGRSVHFWSHYSSLDPGPPSAPQLVIKMSWSRGEWMRTVENMFDALWCPMDYFQRILHFTILLMSGKSPCRYYIYTFTTLQCIC